MEAERKRYEFPAAGEVVGLDFANGSEATVKIPKELLLARGHGIPVHVTHHLINFIAMFFHCRKWYSECGTCSVSKSAVLSSQRCVCTCKLFLCSPCVVYICNSYLKAINNFFAYIQNEQRARECCNL